MRSTPVTHTGEELLAMFDVQLVRLQEIEKLLHERFSRVPRSEVAGRAALARGKERVQQLIRQHEMAAPYVAAAIDYTREVDRVSHRP